jgi:dGTPase
VESFEARYARFPGLNLTFEVREGIVKHSRDLTPGESPELDGYLPEQRPPIEAQIIDLADEVAYNTADLDDAYSAGFFTIDEVRGAVPAFSDIWEAVEMQFPGAEERVQFLETLRQVINLLVSGLLDGTANAIQAAGVATVEEVRRHPRRLVRRHGPRAEAVPPSQGLQLGGVAQGAPPFGAHDRRAVRLL